jgi:cellobiose-specific phosphotransferase system component IIC
LSLLRYSTLVLLVAAATLAAVGLVVPAATPSRAAILFGAVLAILNTLAAHALTAWSERRSTQAFFGAVLGGMVGRMALMLAAVVLGVLLLDLPRLPLVVSLLSYYTLFLVMELTVQHRHAQRPAETR